jgi:hypothetical protein
MITLDDNQKFEAIKYRHEDQSKLLQKMTDVDLKVFISFLTLQLALGGFITQIDLAIESKIGLFMLDIALSLICSILLWNNYKRRKEVSATIRNCNQALGYDLDGVYIENKKINSPTVFRPWFWWYIIGMILSIIGILVILTSTPKMIDKSKTDDTKTEITKH